MRRRSPGQPKSDTVAGPSVLRPILAFAFAAAVVLAGIGVTAQQGSVFRTGTRTVPVFVTVTDATGRLVPDLGRDDFEILDEGRPQEIVVFANDAQPITVVLLLDRSRSMALNFVLEREAAEQFVADLWEADKARIGSFSDQVQIDPIAFTSDHRTLLDILAHNLQDAGPTPLWNAVDAGITALLGQTSRRVVFVFTDGVDEPPTLYGRNASLQDVMRRARAEDVMVYAVGLTGYAPAWNSPPGPRILPPPPPPGGGIGGWPPGPGGIGGRGGRGGIGGGRGGGGRGGRGRGASTVQAVSAVSVLEGRGDGTGEPQVGLPGPVAAGGPGVPGGAPARQGGVQYGPDKGLKKIAAESGGGYFELDSPQNLAATFARVAEELHRQYALGFTPAVFDGKTHELRVRVKRDGLTARARTTYVAAQ